MTDRNVLKFTAYTIDFIRSRGLDCNYVHGRKKSESLYFIDDRNRKIHFLYYTEYKNNIYRLVLDNLTGPVPKKIDALLNQYKHKRIVREFTFCVEEFSNVIPNKIAEILELGLSDPSSWTECAKRLYSSN